MPTTYITKDGDMLDLICLEVYGRSKGVTEHVLNHNARLADLGPVFSSGIEIVMPDLPQASENDTRIKLWS